MSKKFYVITIAVTLIIAAAMVLFFVYISNENQQVGINENVKKTGENYESFPIDEIVKEPSLKIQTDKGEVMIHNIYKDSVEKLSRNGVAFKDNNNYYMAFYPQDNGFLIVIKNHDAVSAEKKAENDFLRQLGIIEEEACRLKVSITVPFSVSEKYSGGVYGFSFCPNVGHIE